MKLASSAFQLLGSLLSPAGPRARLSILIYHRVVPAEDALFPSLPTAQAFDRQIRALAEQFNVLPLAEAIARLRERSLPARAACITFDDGYADNAEVALPILQRHGCPATFFIATDFLDGGRMWNDTVIEIVRRASGPRLDLTGIGLGCRDIATNAQRRQVIRSLLHELKYLPHSQRAEQVARIAQTAGGPLPNDLMMTSGQVRGLYEAGMEIGGHTGSHPILARLDNTAATAEIAAGKEALEAIIRTPVRFFAYPNGKPGEDYTAEQVRAVRALGFEAALTTASGVATAGSDLYQLPRFTPWDRTMLKFSLRLQANLRRTQPDKV